MKIGIILTSDIRSKAYLQKCIKNNLHFESVIFMNDQKREKEFDKKIIELSKQYDFDISVYSNIPNPTLIFVFLNTHGAANPAGSSVTV